jgi:hypothetical protein
LRLEKYQIKDTSSYCPEAGAFAMAHIFRKPTTKKLTTPRQRERARARAFRPLAIELGWLVYEWNRLQEAIGELFADVV